jgi:endonuclease III
MATRVPAAAAYSRRRPRAARSERSPRHGSLGDTEVAQLMAILAKRIVPRTELVYSSTYELLVAVVLSAQATDRSVNAATRTLFALASTPQAMIALGLARLRQEIRHIGLFNTKAANILALSHQLIVLHAGQVPGDRDSLEALPGVGRKTANVVLNIAFGQPTIAVDTHVQRVANRTGIAATSTPEQTEAVLLERIPPRHLMNAHHYLILHGRYCCTARAPQCPRCPLKGLCTFAGKTPA